MCTNMEGKGSKKSLTKCGAPRQSICMHFNGRLCGKVVSRELSNKTVSSTGFKQWHLPAKHSAHFRAESQLGKALNWGSQCIQLLRFVMLPLIQFKCTQVTFVSYTTATAVNLAATNLHSNDGVDEEQHGDQKANIRQRLSVRGGRLKFRYSVSFMRRFITLAQCTSMSNYLYTVNINQLWSRAGIPASTLKDCTKVQSRMRMV